MNELSDENFLRDFALLKINVEHNLKKDSRKLASRERESSACTFSFSFLTKHFFLHFVAVVEATEARRKEHFPCMQSSSVVV